MLMRKSWATPRYAADKGLLLRDTEPDISGVRPPHLPPALTGEGADVCVARKSVEGFGEARRRRAVTMKGLATGEP